MRRNPDGVQAPSLRWLLLAYSLSPAAAKLLGVEALFGAGLLFLMAYLWAIPQPVGVPAGTRPRRHLMPRLPLLAFVAYGLLLGTSLCALQIADTRAALVGGFSFLVPLLIITAAGPQRAARLLHDLPFVAVVHAVLALVMFAPLRPPLAFIESLSETLLTGTAAFRLSSVSGSLALSTTMVASFAVAVHRHVAAPRQSAESRRAWMAAALFLLCGFLSLQRAAWISLTLIGVAGLVAAPAGRRRSVVALSAVVVLPILAALAVLDIPDDALEIFMDRFATLTGGGEIGLVAERSGQWLNVSFNLQVLPIGHGPGQLGQAVRDSGPVTGGLPIFDGDYFRIVSEYGPVGVALILLLLAGAARAVLAGAAALSGQAPRATLVLWAGVLGLMLQLIGTNVSELYFANAVFWSLWLQAWTAPMARRARPRAVQPC